MKVLVVDDEEMARLTTCHVLSKAGYEVLSASNGREALEILSQGTCKLVVTDWEMPEMNGLDFCRAVRSQCFGGYVYVIILTSNKGAQDTIDGLTAGADDYVVKPFNPGELIMRVNTGQRIIGLETRHMAIFTMAKLAESRDKETGAHLERVRSYCRLLADELYRQGAFPGELDAAFAQLIYETSPLHDIGKVAIPDSVLLKPGKLTSEEYEVMKQHTIEGAATLQAALDQYPDAPFLLMARDIAISHHEKYNGQGYPYGLAGDAIPLSGRIVAVADVYDALTTRRSYKEAFTHEASRSIIINDSGSHFDPAIVDAFQQCEDSFIKVQEQYAEAMATAVALV